MATMLFVVGLLGTILNMLQVTEQSLATSAAEFFRANNLGEYHRPAELELLSWLGIIGHPLNYAIWLYVALHRYRAGKLVMWCAIVGAIIAMLFGTLIGALALASHPEIWDFVLQSTQPTPTPTP